MATRSLDAYSIAKHSLMNRIAGEVIFSDQPGEAMKKWRNLFEESQTELAKVMGIAPSVLSDYEKNRRKSPGTNFIRRYVTALVELDDRRGGGHVKRFSNFSKDLSRVVLDIAEFTKPRTAGELAQALDGVWLAGREQAGTPIYGYTVIDSLSAIKNLDAQDFLYLFGANSVRLIVFTGVTTGRSPMIAVKIYPIKPRMVAIHGPQSESAVDRLGIELAERETIPYVLSMKKEVRAILDSLTRLGWAKPPSSSA